MFASPQSFGACRIGSKLRLRLGDEVFYAGSIARPGANAEFHPLDSRIVGPKPATLSGAAAAASPLTAIAAWKTPFDRLDIRRHVPGAGGVGSIAVQLVRALTDVTVIATASRPETQDWVRPLGAYHVVDHARPLTETLSPPDAATLRQAHALIETGKAYGKIGIESF